MAYDFYLDGCLLPVTPQKLQLKIKNQNRTMTLINEGEVNVLKNPGLTDVSFDMEVPQVKYPYLSGRELQSAEYYLGMLELLKDGRKPFQFIVTRSAPGGKEFFYTDMRVSLEEYQINEDVSNGFDLSISVGLKQYRDYATKIRAISWLSDTAGAGSGGRTSDQAPAADSYTVQKGDCLWKIAKKYYNNGSDYTKIFDANEDQIHNPNLIYPGQILVLP